MASDKNSQIPSNLEEENNNNTNNINNSNKRLPDEETPQSSERPSKRQLLSDSLSTTSTNTNTNANPNPSNLPPNPITDSSEEPLSDNNNKSEDDTKSKAAEEEEGKGVTKEKEEEEGKETAGVEGKEGVDNKEIENTNNNNNIGSTENFDPTTTAAAAASNSSSYSYNDYLAAYDVASYPTQTASTSTTAATTDPSAAAAAAYSNTSAYTNYADYYNSYYYYDSTMASNNINNSSSTANNIANNSINNASNDTALNNSTSNENNDGSPAQVISIRSIITLSNVGPIIGRNGTNIKYFREQANCKIQISETAPGATERILTITGDLNGVSKAYSLIFGKLYEESLLPGTATTSKPVLRILVPHSQVGSIIGKSGSNIKYIQETSGARITVSEEVLMNSTERCVTISGLPEQVTPAIAYVFQKISEAPLPPTIMPYRPMAQTYNYPTPPAYAGYDYSRSGIPAYGNYPEVAYPPVQSQQQISVPNEYIGCIIGRAGSKISEVRQQSGAQVRISEAVPGELERVVTITGTPQGIQTALYMLYKEINNEKVRVASRG